MESMETYTRKAVFDNLRKYCIFSNSDDDFIEISEWKNGEGYDINIVNGTSTKFFQLSHGELEAINHLRNYLTFNFNDKDS